MRWIWIDRFVDFRPGEKAVSVKNVSFAEEPFGEHFPDWPIFPAALMLEGLAQTGGILIGEARDFKEKVVLAKITSAAFTREAVAGDVLTYTATIIVLRDEGASVRGTVEVRGEKIGEAEIFFAHLDANRSGTMFGDHNFVFSGELKYLLGLARKANPRPEPEGTISAG